MPGTTTLGIRSATLSVPAGSPPTVALSGTATQASISVPTSINFGSQLAGGAGGSPQPIVITNSSSGAFAGALTIASVAKSGGNPGDFALVTDACTGASTPPGATCSVQVAFKPLQSGNCGANGGSRTGTLILNDNAPGSPHSIPLSGTAMDFCIASSPGQAVVEPIVAGQSATYLLELDSSAGLTGTASLSCSVPAQLLGSCSISTTPATNPPVAQISSGSPGQFKVVVTTTAPGGAVVVNRARPGTAMRPGGRLIVWIAIPWLVVLMTSMVGRRRSGYAKAAQVGALLLACAIAMAACGGGGGGTPADPPPPGTPAGTYVITLTATVNLAGQPSVTRTFPLSLTVQ